MYIVGNASFYSNALYGDMLSLTFPGSNPRDPTSSSPFYGLLQSLRIPSPLDTPPPAAPTSVEEEKLRSNAAGAVGNLVRNGDQLCAELIRIRVPQALMGMVLQERLVSPLRIAMFSLGTLVMYQSCRLEMTTPTPTPMTAGGINTAGSGTVTISDVISYYQQLHKQTPLDETVAKYLIRLKQNL